VLGVDGGLGARAGVTIRHRIWCDEFDYDARCAMVRRRGIPVNQHKHGQEEKAGRAGPAKWVIVVAVLLMLAGIAAYILSLDEAIAPATSATTGSTAGATGVNP
jgi:hypothetical protein